VFNKQLFTLCSISHVFVVDPGGFRGDGPHFMSFDVLDDEDKQLFNIAFKVQSILYSHLITLQVH